MDAELSNRELREESAAKLPLRRGLLFIAVGLAGVFGTWVAQRNGALAGWQPPLGLFSVVVAQFALLLGIGSLSAVVIRSIRGPAARAVGTTVEVANISRYERDGQGNYSAVTVENAGGTVAHLATTGTYTVNPDCTGTQEGVGATGAVTHYELVIGNAGRTVELLRTDQPVLSGTQTRQ